VSPDASERQTNADVADPQNVRETSSARRWSEVRLVSRWRAGQRQPYGARVRSGHGTAGGDPAPV